jgi:drug/metabolite transporter (DMT)-like permease
MNRSPVFGIALALVGVLVLTPDTLLMRLSGLSGWAMLAWRGFGMAAVFLCVWALTARDRRRDLAMLFTGAGAAVVLCQIANQAFFTLGIAAAPVAMVLFGVAAVPVFSAVFAWILVREPTHPATWAATCLVFVGIGVAASGKSADGLAFEASAVLGGLAGLGVAAGLAGSFVLIRLTTGLSILLTIAVGSVCSAMLGVVFAGPQALQHGTLWPILLAAFVVLPISFGAMWRASRHTQAANVSLILLLETVLGPLWVWAGVGEAPTARMMLGGAIVVATLAGYIAITARLSLRSRPAA